MVTEKKCNILDIMNGFLLFQEKIAGEMDSGLLTNFILDVNNASKFVE